MGRDGAFGPVDLIEVNDVCAEPVQTGIDGFGNIGAIQVAVFAAYMRHVARRMARASIASAASYLAWLRLDEGELTALSREMLINVTGFFRDPQVFAYLAKDVVPALVRDAGGYHVPVMR